jgi:excisionase family DNA binding protein
MALDQESKVSPNLRLLSIAETAAILDVSRKLISSWIHSGALPAIRLGPGQRLIRIRQKDLEAFIEAGKMTPDEDGCEEENG